MVNFTGQTLRIVVATCALWVLVAVLTWWTTDPPERLVTAKPHSLMAADMLALRRLNLAEDQTMLERTRLWPMERDGLAQAAKPPAQTVDKKVVWGIAATVVRPRQSYLLVQDLETKVITQTNVGDTLPDGSKLLKVSVDSYEVRASNGKRHTVDTGH